MKEESGANGVFGLTLVHLEDEECVNVCLSWFWKTRLPDSKICCSLFGYECDHMFSNSDILLGFGRWLVISWWLLTRRAELSHTFVGIGSDHSHLNQFSLSWMDGWIPHYNFLFFIFFSKFLFLNVFNYIQNEYNL